MQITVVSITWIKVMMNTSGFGIQDRDHHPQDIIVNSGYRAIMAKEGEVPFFRAYRFR